MKNLVFSFAAIGAALMIRFFDSQNAIPVMGGTQYSTPPSLTLSDLADDLFERSIYRQ